MILRLVLLLCGAILSTLALAQSSPTLERIRESEAIRIGFVPDAAPMSFLDGNGNAVGYSIELCRHIAGSIRDQLGLAEIELTFVPLRSMEDRISAVVRGDVDIECGATTVTLTRRERVDFTLTTYITGGSIMSRESAPIQSVQDINGKSIAVTGNTTTELNLRKFANTNDYDVSFVVAGAREDAIDALAGGEVDGYASDHAMLVGLAYLSGNNRFRIARDVFSFEPYALMVARGDTEFRLAADRSLAALYRTARIRRIHHNWFGRYGIPMSPVIEAMFELQAVAE